jgi:cell division protein FtsB
MAAPAQVPPSGGGDRGHLTGMTSQADTNVKDSISTTCSVSNMSISSVDVDLDPDVRVICRDFIRGVCGRKKRCKFQHPNAQSLNQLVQCNPEKKYAFCHDYQNKICERQSCKYIHCSSEEEQQYLKSHLLCLKYKCQYELGIYNLGLNSFKHLNDGSRKGSINHKYGTYSDNENETKRLRSNSGLNSRNADSLSNQNRSSEADFPRSSKHPCPHHVLEESRNLKKENEALKERISELQRQVHNLSTMNEMLLEQNAQYRQNSRQTPIQPITVHPVPGIQQPGIQQSPVCNLVPPPYSGPTVQGSMYTPSPQGQVVSMRVVNNSTVMTPNVISQPGAPAVMTTVPQPVSTSMQPPVSTHTQNVVPINQMRPPPGLQTITVQPEQLQSPNQRFNPGTQNMGVHMVSGSHLRVPVASVQNLPVQTAPVQQSSLPALTPNLPQSVPQSQNPQDISGSQVAVVATYQQNQRPQQTAPTSHLTGGAATLPMNGYPEIQRISVHHQQHQ